MRKQLCRRDRVAWLFGLNLIAKKCFGAFDFFKPFAVDPPEPISNIAQKASVVTDKKARSVMRNQFVLKRLLPRNIEMVCRLIQQIEVWVF